MGISSSEQIKRREQQATFRACQAEGRIIEAERKAEIREQAVAAFLRNLDGRLANLQEGEHLMIQIDIKKEHPHLSINKKSNGK